MEQKSYIVFKIIKWIRRVFVLLIVLLTMLFISLYVFVTVYETEIKSRAIQTINKHLLTEAIVLPENIDILMLKTFPMVGLQFKNLLLKGSNKHNPKDTLIFAKNVYVSFNIKDVLNNRYVIRKIELDKGCINLNIQKDGLVNYQFWKQDTIHTTTNNKDGEFELSSIVLNGIYLKVNDFESNLFFNQFLSNLKLSGYFSSKNIQLDVKAQSKIEYINYQKKQYAKNTSVNFYIKLGIKNKVYQIYEALINVNNNNLKASGIINANYTTPHFSLKYQLNKLKATDLIEHLPIEFQDQIKPYQTTGTFNLDGSFNYFNNAKYDLLCNLQFIKGQLKLNSPKLTFEEIFFNSTIKLSAHKENISINAINLKIKNSAFNGNINVSNFKNLNGSFNLKSNIQTKDLLELWPNKYILHTKGTINSEIQFSGSLKNLLNKEFDKTTFNAAVKLNDTQVELKNDSLVWIIPQASISINQYDKTAITAIIKKGQSQLGIEGNIDDLLNYVLQQKSNLNVDLKCNSSKLILDDYKSTSTNTSSSFAIPSFLRGSISMDIAQLEFKSYDLQQLQGKLELINNGLVINNLKFKTCDGIINLKSHLNLTHPKVIKISGAVDFENVSMSLFLKQFKNFGQTTLTHQHLKGLITGSSIFSFNLNPKMYFDANSLELNTSFEITKGELKNMPTLVSLSKFSYLPDFKNLNFSKLKSEIYIKNRVIQIAPTQVKTNALDFEIYGNQTFDLDLDYHIQILLNDLIYKQTQVQFDKDHLITIDKNNKRKLHLLITGNVGNPKFKWDKSKVKEKLKEDFKKEKETLKSILSKEVEQFKTDSSVKAENQKFKFEIESKKSDKQKSNKKQKKKQVANDDDF